MALSKKEQAMLDALTEKASQPERAPVGRSLTAHVDLTDPKSVALAIKHGFLEADEDDDDDDGKDGDDDGDETPKRKGYFG